MSQCKPSITPCLSKTWFGTLRPLSKTTSESIGLACTHSTMKAFITMAHLLAFNGNEVRRGKSLIERGLQRTHEDVRMTKTINVVVTCANRKTVAPESDLEARTLKATGIGNRALHWIRRLSSPSRSGAVVASNLYCGEHWSVARSIPSVAKKAGRCTRIWICSAGYGLISPCSRVHSYSATFASSDDNSVTNGSKGTDRRHAAKQWWAKLAQWRGPVPETVRTFSKLARKHPNDALLVVASRDYLLAVEDDLKNAEKELSSPSLLMVISAGTRQLGTLSAHLLPCDARLQSCLGGTRVSLNARIARRLIGGSGATMIEMSSAKRYLSALLRTQSAIAGQSRIRSTNAEVKRFIKHKVAAGGATSPSRLLEKFRSSGRACEQSRFAHLYRMAVGRK